jgi:ElaA protein
MNNDAITWVVKPFEELTLRELHDLLRLRVDVFVVEQTCAYAEIDGQDPFAVHVLGVDGSGACRAYARVLPKQSDGLPHIGRVVVHPEYRGRKLAKALMIEALRQLERAYGNRRNAIAAQTYLVPFYASLGYVPTSEEYVWDGIPHMDMVLDG